MEPEELIYLTNEALAGCIVTDYASEDERYVTTGVYTIASAASEDGEGYDMFLDGAKSLLTIENPASTTSFSGIPLAAASRRSSQSVIAR